MACQKLIPNSWKLIFEVLLLDLGGGPAWRFSFVSVIWVGKMFLNATVCPEFLSWLCFEHVEVVLHGVLLFLAVKSFPGTSKHSFGQPYDQGAHSSMVAQCQGFLCALYEPCGVTIAHRKYQNMYFLAALHNQKLCFYFSRVSAVFNTTFTFYRT